MKAVKPKKKTTSKAELIKIDDLQAEQQLNKCLKKALKGFNPPENLTVSEWADKYRVLPREGAAEGGKWRTSRTPYFKEVMDSFTDPTINRIVVVAAAQVGKALDVKTKIPTPDGWKEMGSLNIGDTVFDENGKTCKVINATEIMKGRPCYRVAFSDGSEIVADAEHLWMVNSSKRSNIVLTTKQIAEEEKSKYSIPDAKPIQGIPTPTTEQGYRVIVNVEQVESVPVRCIEVDSPNHLYLAGPAMIPTHNSEFELNAIGYIIDQDPGPILYIHPNLEEAQKFSTQRFGPMVRDTKVLRRKVSSAKRGDARNTRLQKNFPGGLITMCGTQSPAALASAPMRYVICDERDRWARTTGKEGDPFKLAQARQTTFYNRKTIEVSTPTIKGDSPIAESYELGTKERWCVQCPACGEWFEVTFSQIRFEKKEEEQAGRIVTIVQDGVDAECPHCGVLTPERQIRKQPHKWIAQNPAAKQKGIRSFWLNAFSSPWVSWKSICQEVVDAKNDPEKLKTVYNTKLGELWEDRGDTEDEEFYYDRREDYGKLDNGIPVDVPKGPVLLTMGVDTQDNRLEYEVLGHGHYKETWGIKKGTIMGLPSDSETWRKLDEVLMKDWIRFDGKRMKIAFTCIDSGGHYTPEVYAYCRSRMMYRVFAIKGVGGESVSFTTPYTKQSIGDTRQKVRLYKIGVDAGKAAIMANLRVMAPGPGYCHFPKRPDAGYDMRYFNGLLSERMEFNEKTRKYMWVKIIGHERNEPLDIRNYALAAFELLHKDTFAAEKELEAMGTEYVSASPPPKKPPQRKRKGGFDPYGDF